VDIVLDLSFHPRQQEAFNSEASEILFGGASEGGKSAFLRRALCTWCIEIPNLQCTLIRKKFSDIIKNHVFGDDGFNVLLAPLVKAGMVSITADGVKFYNGSIIFFQHCQDERQFTTAQGSGTHVVAIDEATQISARLINAFRGWCRMSAEMRATLPEKYRNSFPKIIYTANPIGVSLGHFRRAFIKARPAWEIELVEGFKRQFIPSKIDDNPSADKAAQKARLAAFDAGTAKALIDGDWDAPLGDFYPEWDESRHVIPDARIPDHWFRFRAFDWGSGEPFAVLWFAYSDGAKIGNTYIPRGSLIVYREWYGCDPDDSAKGLHMRNEDVAIGILQRTEKQYWSQPTLADRFPFADRGEETIAQRFKKNGVTLTPANDSRVAGWSVLRDRLIGIPLHDDEKIRYPLIYVMQSCKFTRDYIPMLPRHPAENKAREDAAEHGEATHICDTVRMGSIAHTIIKDAPIPTGLQISRAIKQKRTMSDIMKEAGDGTYN
jgi:hypothetical protein